MPLDIMDFISKPTNPKNYIIDQLISTDSGFGLIAGRTGLGKTNMLLNLSCILSTGSDFFGLPTKKSKVDYFTFEGGEDNFKDRYIRILGRGYAPEKDYLQIDRIDSLVLLDKANIPKFKTIIAPFDVVIFDPIKWMVGGAYCEPKAVAEFTKIVTEILHREHKLGIFSIQIRKRDQRHKADLGDLFELKGAADYVEDATFALLLERSELRGKGVVAGEKDKHLTLYFAKKREAIRDLYPVELYYDYAGCEFQVK